MYPQYQKYKGFARERDTPPTTGVTLLPTPGDIEGPFYKAGAPVLPSGVLGRPGHAETAVLRMRGQVLNSAGLAIVGAVLDVWQADETGVYDNEGFQFRGRFKTDANGRYSFETVVPGDYQINDNPPDFRCAHIHVKLSAPGYKLLTTQLYFPGDNYNKTDHWFDERRVIALEQSSGVFEFVLAQVTR